MKNPAIFLIALVVLLALAGWKAFPQGPKRATWEYKSVVATLSDTPPVKLIWREDGKEVAGTVVIQQKTKELGAEGWELVSVAFGERVFAYWFKRPLNP